MNLPLSPIDHIFTGAGAYPIEFVFSYERQIDAKRLLASLKEVLNVFWPAKCTIINDEGRYVFAEHRQGFSFEEKWSDINFDESNGREQFIDPVSTCEGEILNRIRLTRTPAGSVLGISMSHCVADGFSYFHLLSSWAKAFHGKPFHPPVHNRQLLIPDQAMPGDVLSTEVLQGSGLFLNKRRTEVQRDKLRWETERIPASQLKMMLAKAQDECEVRLSFNDVIVAFLWKKYLLTWGQLKDDQQTFISCPFDYRRMLKDFPPTYFGNAVALITTSLSYLKLKRASISDLAVMIRKNIGSLNADMVRKSLLTIYSLNASAGLEVNERLHVAHPDSGLLVTNLSRLPVKEIAFDAGPPVRYEILTPSNRGAVILPAADGVEVRVCCPYE